MILNGAIPAFESSRQKTNLWLKDVAAELHLQDRRKAYAALRAVLHALRACLPVEETAKFAAQMPLLLQGVFYEGWRPHRKPERMTRESFFECLRHSTRNQPGLDAALVARAVFITLARRLSAGEIESARRVLPHEVRELWYELGHHVPAELAEREETLREEQPAPQAPDDAHEPRLEALPTEAFQAYEPGSQGRAPAWP